MESKIHLQLSNHFFIVSCGRNEAPEKEDANAGQIQRRGQGCVMHCYDFVDHWSRDLHNFVYIIIIDYDDHMIMSRSTTCPASPHQYLITHQ